MTLKFFKKSLLFISAIFLVLGLSISFQSLLAAWTAPTANPPTCAAGNPGCDAPLNAGPLIQPKSGALWLNTNGLSPYGLIVESGKVGIGTTNPSEKLTVAGGHGDTKLRLYSTGDGGSQPANLSLWASEPGWTYTGTGIGYNVKGSPYYGRIDNARGSSYVRFLPGETKFEFQNTSNTYISNVLVLKESGNVGIGTTGPGAKLQSYGTYSGIFGTDGLLKIKSIAGQCCGTETVKLQTTIDDRTDDYTPSSYGGDSRHVLALQPDGGYVGIGTTGPETKFTVDQTGSDAIIEWTGTLINRRYANDIGQGIGLRFRTSHSGDPNTWAGIAGVSNETFGRSVELAFYTNSWSAAPTEKVRITSTGNVGIGTTGPQYKLDVKSDGTGAVWHRMGLTNSPSDRGVFLGTYNGNAGVFAHNFANNAWRDLYINTVTGTTGMVVQGNGNVGIGTTGPGQKLDVNGYVKGTGLCIGGDCKTAWSQVAGVGGSGTANYISKFTAATTLGNSLIYDNGTGVGIGTTNPSEKLTVAGGHGDTKLRLYSTGDGGSQPANLSLWASEPGWTYTGTGIGYNVKGSPYYGRIDNARGSSYVRFLPGETKFEFQNTSNTYISNVLVLKENGNVGIGTTGPQYKLDVKSDGTGAVWHRMGLTNSPSDRGVFLGTYNGNAGVFAHNFANNAWRDLYINTVTGTTGMVVQGNGNVGIGTTGPGYKLQVQGDVYADGGWVRVSGARGLYFQSYGGGWYMTDSTWIRSYGNKNIYHNTGIMRTDGTLQVGSGGGTLNVASGGNFAYRTNVLFANTAGNVGIGTTGPGQKLDVNGNIRAGSTGAGYVYLGNRGYYIGDDLAGTDIQTNAPNFYVYDGGWKRLLREGDIAGGDITGVYAGTNLTGGGASGEVTLSTKMDPTFNDVYVNNWFRVNGGGGIYWQAYGGGWYMTDSTWIRSYGNKNIYHNTGIMRTDGTLQVGSGGGTLNVASGGNFAYRTNVLFANTAGNVGIGTTNPGAKLEVAGAIKATALQIPGTVANVVTVQTRTQGTYGAPASGNGTAVTPLDIVITPKKAGNKIILEWIVNGEAHHNIVYIVTRNGELLANTTDAFNNRWAGITAQPDDDNISSTPDNAVVKIIDMNSLDVETTYELRVRVSGGTAHILYLNRCADSAGKDHYEANLSTGIAMEIWQ